MLPDSALRHLIALCSACIPFGMPAFLMHGRACVLSKCDNPKAFGDGRPITVLSAIYRLWSSVLSFQLLQGWKNRLPASIYGGVPGRSARDVTMAQQHHIELALIRKEELSGFVRASICYHAPRWGSCCIIWDARRPWPIAGRSLSCESNAHRAFMAACMAMFLPPLELQKATVCLSAALLP